MPKKFTLQNIMQGGGAIVSESYTGLPRCIYAILTAETFPMNLPSVDRISKLLLPTESCPNSKTSTTTVSSMVSVIIIINILQFALSHNHMSHDSDTLNYYL